MIERIDRVYSKDEVMGMMEPLIIVFLGGAVGGLLIAMYMPMFSMGDAVKG